MDTRDSFKGADAVQLGAHDAGVWWQREIGVAEDLKRTNQMRNGRLITDSRKMQTCVVEIAGVSRRSVEDPMELRALFGWW